MGAAKILVIDDSATDVFILQCVLDDQGEEYELEVLADGAAALNFVQEHRSGVRKPDVCVILLDLRLPKHNGLAVLEAINRTPALSHIKVIVLTGNASPGESAQVRALGAFFREKPAELSDFRHLAREILAICKGVLSAMA
jgi:CheY-like chemotaxis protein